MTFDINGLKNNPHDSEAWLVYADHLQSAGEINGELIVLEHGLFNSPGPLEGSDYSRLIKAREETRKTAKKELKKKGVSHILDWYHGIPRGVHFNGTPEQKAELTRDNPFIQCIETITGDYRAFSRLVPGGRRHVDELWSDRLIVSGFRNKWFYTADGSVYFLSRDGKNQDLSGEPYFALTRDRSNPAFKNIDLACEQLRLNRNYAVSNKDMEKLLADPETKVFNLQELGLNDIYNLEFSYLEIPTIPDSQSLNNEQRRLVERVYGKGDNFNKVMTMLRGENWQTARIYTLNPNYVRIHASANAMGRASGLLNSDFSTGGHGIDSRYLLCGVVSSERSES